MKIKNILMAVACCFTALTFTACGDPDDEVTSLKFSRNFAPTGFELKVTNLDSNGSTVSFGFIWGNPGNPETYVFEIYAGEEITEGATPVATLYPTAKATEQDPYLVNVADLALEEGSYIARIKAIAPNTEDSRWTVLEKAFKVKDASGPVVVTKTASLDFEIAATDPTVGSKYEFGCLTMDIVDTQNKFVMDTGTAYFGEADDYTKHTGRLKTGATYAESKNSITITSTAKGKLTIAVRSASSSAVRSLSVQKDGAEVAKFTLDDSQKVQSADIPEGAEGPVSVFPLFTLDVEEGVYEFVYADGSINFYAFDITYEEIKE